MTTTRPAPVTIDDLADPRFPAEAVPIREAMAEMGASIVIEPDALREAAIAQTGLDDFGDRAYEERLDVLCKALREEAGLSAAGKTTTFTQLAQLLANRLLIQDLLKKHPEIHELNIERPIVIAGQPRTGTTHLHNLMSSDPSLRSLPYWESHEPVLPASERDLEIDPRRERTALGLDVINTAMPYFKRMHEMTPDHVHEEIHLLAIDFSTMAFETMEPMPSWRDYYKSMDQTPVVRLLEDGTQGPSVAPRRKSLATEVSTAPRTIRSADDNVPRRHGGDHAPRPGGRYGLDGDDALLRLAAESRAR